MAVAEFVHGRFVYGRRVGVLADCLARLLPVGARVLDVGAGDGLLASCLTQRRSDLDCCGIDVLVRPHTFVPVRAFDGRTIPFPDRSFDAVLCVDVLHHADDPMALLRELVRVSHRTIVIKDHLLEGWFAGATLRFMDRVGNRRHGVVLPYNYWPRARWLDAFHDLGLTIHEWLSDLRLYPFPFSLLFDRCLHFVARLERVGDGAAPMPSSQRHVPPQ